MNERFIIANRTDVGRVREVNEDSMVTFDSPNGRVVAVCDGMGGQAAGDVASRLACDIITDILSNNTFSTPTEAITRACLAANQGILHRAAQNPELEGMGATCVIVIIKNGLVYYGWVGDSRIYYISNGEIRQISRDQSYVQQLVDSGQISAAEAEHHPMKNEILNALGLQEMTPPELCTTPLTPEPDSAILLCSDGLSGMVDNQTILSIVTDKELSPQKRVEKLVDRANENGGQDNITVQLIQFGDKAAAAKTGNADSDKGNKNKMLIWAGAAIAAIIIILFLFLFTGKKSSDKPFNQQQIQDNRGTSTTSSPKTETTVKDETIVVKEQKSGKKESKNSKEDKTKKKFGTKDETKKENNNTGKRIKEVNKNTNDAPPMEDPNIMEQIEQFK